jgi:inorganic pyrophosphatase
MLANPAGKFVMMAKGSWPASVQIIAVHADDPEYKHITDVSELPKHRILEIRRFFEDYKKNENKEVRWRTCACHQSCLTTGQ